MELVGRRSESAELARLIATVREGRSAVLVVRGDAGVGKTALLEDALTTALGFRVAHTVGVQSEVELAYAALEHLCGPMLDRLDRLPEPQHAALGAALGVRAGTSAGAVPGRTCGAQPVIGRRRRAAVAVCGGRCPVARPPFG